MSDALTQQAAEEWRKGILRLQTVIHCLRMHGVFHDEEGDFTDDLESFVLAARRSPGIAPESSPVVPAGYVQVPAEPTPEMIDAGVRAVLSHEPGRPWEDAIRAGILAALSHTQRVAPQRDSHFGGSSYEASMLRNLLAVIHGDGGHYLARHGLDKAAEDAEALVATWRARVAPIGDDRLHEMWLEAVGRALTEEHGEAHEFFARALLAEALHPSPALQARTLSDFIRTATPEEKEAVYLEVMDKATARQLETMAAPQEQRAAGVPGTYKDVTGESNG